MKSKQKNDFLTLKDIGVRMRELRLAQNLTQKELANLIEKSPTAVSRLENGVGVTGEILINLLSYYASKGIDLTLLFSQEFDAWNINTSMNSITLRKLFLEKINLLKKEYTTTFEEFHEAANINYLEDIKKQVNVFYRTQKELNSFLLKIEKLFENLR